MKKSLKNIIYKNLQRMTIGTMVLILLLAVWVQIMTAEKQARDHASATFQQVEQIIRENGEELTAIEKDYRDTCLLNAEVIAYVIQHHPELLGDVVEFRQFAHMLQVDEIHIFDQTGRIFTGTHPEYYDFTFDSGEQMNFFKPMMEDRSLRLCQDITPNTAEGKLVQYSALWSSDEQFIVQVGMYPDAVLEVTRKNELSYIFSLLQGNPGVSLYAINAENGTVIGSTSGGDSGKALDELGFVSSDLEQYKKGAHVTIEGVNSYCIMEEREGTLLGYVISNDQLYSNIVPYTLMLVLCLLMIAVVFMLMIWKFTDHLIISSISNINGKLRAVAEGNLNERVEIHSSLEFSDLGNYINQMIQSLLSSTDKMSFVLDRTDMHIGVYEYNEKMKTVRFTEHIPEIFGLDPEEMALLSADYRRLQTFVDQLRKEPVQGMENTYYLAGKAVQYVKLEEIVKGNDVLGILMDVTEETLNLKRAEKERDIDALTGLYNRRGMEHQLAKLVESGESLKNGALMMVDSDDLKKVNDTYGHATGDAYLKSIAETLRDFASAKQLVARLGGDEFMVLLYGYENGEIISEDISRLRRLRDGLKMTLSDGVDIPVQFSYGFVLTDGRQDFDAMIYDADKLMYIAKRNRKGLPPIERFS